MEAHQVLVRCWSRPANCGSLTWPISIRPGAGCSALLTPVESSGTRVWFGRLRKNAKLMKSTLGGLSAWSFECFILQETRISCITVSDIWLGGVALAGEWFWRCFWMYFVCSWPYASISMFHPTQNSNGFIYSHDRFQDVQRLFQTAQRPYCRAWVPPKPSNHWDWIRLVRKPAVTPLGFRKVRVNLVVFVDGWLHGPGESLPFSVKTYWDFADFPTRRWFQNTKSPFTDLRSVPS